MSFRKWANQNGKLVTVVIVVLLVICGWVLIRQSRAMFSSGVPSGAYYTSDDGKTWFKDALNKPTPFMVDGKEAVEAHVFSCNGDEFVAYMTRLTPEAKSAIEKFNAARASGKPIDGELARGMAFASMSGKQFKRPGEDKWVSQGQSGEVSKMQAPKCKDGSEAISGKL